MMNSPLRDSNKYTDFFENSASNLSSCTNEAAARLSPRKTNVQGIKTGTHAKERKKMGRSGVHRPLHAVKGRAYSFLHPA